jgi:quinol monooxygenase YgiN
MADAPIVVFASFTPKPGQEKEVEQVLRGMVGPTRNETGCRRYDLYRAAEGAATFHLFEIYADRPALEAHRATDHYKAYRARIQDLLAEPIKVNVLSGVDVRV